MNVVRGMRGQRSVRACAAEKQERADGTNIKDSLGRGRETCEGMDLPWRDHNVNASPRSALTAKGDSLITDPHPLCTQVLLGAVFPFQ
jgi:hypothetical protein